MNSNGRRTRSASEGPFNTPSRVGRMSAAAVRVDNSSFQSAITEVSSSGSSDVTPGPAKTQRSSTSSVGVPTQTRPSPASLVALGTSFTPLGSELSRRSNGAPLLPSQSWFPSAVGQTPNAQPQLSQQNNKYDIHMADNSTHAESIQNIQNHIVIAMTSSDPMIVAEAWRVVEAARAEASATREAAQQIVHEVQNAAQQTVHAVQVAAAGLEQQAQTALPMQEQKSRLHRSLQHQSSKMSKTQLPRLSSKHCMNYTRKPQNTLHGLPHLKPKPELLLHWRKNARIKSKSALQPTKPPHPQRSLKCRPS